MSYTAEDINDYQIRAIQRISQIHGGGLFAGCPEHGVLLRQLLGVQLASFSKRVDIRGTEVVLHDDSAMCFATLINEPCLSGCYPHPQHVGCCQAPE